MNRMKTKTSIILALVFVLTMVDAQTLRGKAILSGMWQGQEIEYLDSYIIVGLEPDSSRSSGYNLFNQQSLTVVQDFDRLNIALLETTSGFDIFEIISSLQNSPNIAFAEPNMLGYVAEMINDPYYLGTSPAEYPHQWSYKNTGQNPPSGTVDADINADEAWSLETGANDVLIAVLDTGIPLDVDTGELNHPDLDDPNRYILGPDFIDSQPDGDGVRDCSGHGTHVTGTIAAETNNGIGIAGICQNCKILTIQVFDSNNMTDPISLINGVYAAVDYGATIINFSGGFTTHVSAVESAVKYANSQGITQIYSAGNDSYRGVRCPARHAHVSYNEEYENYPNGYPTIISVAATDHHDEQTSYSSYSSEYIHVTLAAPGGYGGFNDDTKDIFSTSPGYSCDTEFPNEDILQSYAYKYGTSMAAPHVSGTAGLMLSANPDLTAIQIREILQFTAVDVNASSNLGNDRYLGYGRIDAYEAVKVAKIMADNNLTMLLTGIVFGEITEGVLLYGDVTIPEDIEVNMNVNIMVYNSNLSIIGSENNPIIITGDSWEGIKITNSHILLNYVNITGSNLYGICLDGNTSGWIKNCNINDNNIGIELHSIDNTFLLSDNNIFENQLIGVLIYNSSLNIINNDIYSNSFIGITFLGGSNPKLNSNHIYLNGLINGDVSSGVYILGSSPTFIDKINETLLLDYPVNNEIYLNSIGIKSSWMSTPNLGVYSERLMPNGNWVNGGFNHIYDNNLPIERFHNDELDETYTPFVFAEVNYWFSDLEDEREPSILHDAPGYYTSPTAPSVIEFDRQADSPTVLRDGLIKEQDEEYTEARVLFDEYLNDEPVFDGIKTALGGIHRTYENEDNLSDLATTLENYSESTNEALSTTARTHLISVYKKLGLDEEAIAMAESLIADYVDTELEPYYILELTLLLEETDGSILGRTDNTNIESRIQRVYTNYADSEPAELLRLLFGSDNAIQQQGVIPETFALHHAYPNPFNPMTNIMYDISEESSVSITIYDLSGRKIETLVNKTIQPGQYNVTWDAKGYASGVYFVKLHANEFIQIQKLMLVK
jgi:subtilisin family serine protease